MQTIDRPSQPGSGSPRRGPRLPGGSGLGWLVAGVALIPVLLLLIVSKWGVLIAVLAAVTAGLGLWVLRRGFAFIEVVAFLIHFDGLGVGQLRLGRIVAAVAVLVIAYKLIVERWRPPAIPVRHWIGPLVFTMVAVLSGAWSLRSGRWFFAMGLLCLALAFFGVTALLVDSHEKIQRYLRAFWVGGLWGSGAGVLALFLGTRSVGFGGDPNYFGLIQASMIPLTVYYRRNARTPREKFLYTVALLFVFAGAAGAGSRSGIIGASIVIVATMVTRPGLSTGRRVKSFGVALVVASVCFVVLFVANPNNLQRGFADRGAGRLDVWTASFDLIGERPLFGWGFGQLAAEIPQQTALSPGVLVVGDERDVVAAHNTWVEVVGDLGIVGLLAWVAIFVVTFLGFIRVRWRQTKELSTTLCVMMLPVMSSSQFLPLMNNKLCWSLIGLSAALQVPSWQARYRGYARSWSRSAELALPSGAGTVEPDDAAAPPGQLPPASNSTDWVEPHLARWDLRVSRRFRMVMVAGPVIGFLVFGAVAARLPVHYVAQASILVPKMDDPDNPRFATDPQQTQAIHTLIASGAFAQALGELSGLPLDASEIEERVSVVRPKFGAYIDIRFTDTSEANAQLALGRLTAALDEVVTSSRAASLGVLAEELRPQNPGEQRFYTGPLYVVIGSDTVLVGAPPRAGWISFIGAITGFLVASGLVLLQQRWPRVNNDDDFVEAIGTPVWTHVGRAGRRYAATRDQYAQVMTMATELSPPNRPPRRIVVATPQPDRAARGLAMGVAGALAAEGRRVVLVDAQVDHPLLSLRLGGLGRKGLVQAADGSAPLESVVRRVNRWRLPSSVRRVVRHHGDGLRFIPIGRRARGERREVRPDVLDRFGPEVCVVVLAPSLLSAVPAAALVRWADATTLALVEGRTVTFDAEDAAVQVHTFAAGPAGVVLLDV